MTQNRLQSIIDQFEETKLKSDALFGIFQFAGGSDESYIKANKEGLELFALKLLQAAKQTEAIIADPEKQTIPFDYDEDWFIDDSDTVIHYIEPTTERQIVKQKEIYTTKLDDKLVPFGCGLIALVLLLSLIIGLWTILKWIF